MSDASPSAIAPASIELFRYDWRQRGAWNLVFLAGTVAGGFVAWQLLTIPDVQVRFRWKPGSLAFWDNRATQHVVSNDFLPAKRVMERVTVVGDKPY